MGALLVLVFSIAVGTATYAVTIRNGRRTPAAVGFDGGSGLALASSAAASVPAAETPDEDPLGGGATVFPGPPAAERSAVLAPTTPAPVTDPGYTYLRIETRGPSWRDRVAGLAGLIVMLIVGAAILAFSVYQAGHAVNDLVQRFLNG
jgi:hypothetical protein